MYQIIRICLIARNKDKKAIWLEYHRKGRSSDGLVNSLPIRDPKPIVEGIKESMKLHLKRNAKHESIERTCMCETDRHNSQAYKK